MKLKCVRYSVIRAQHSHASVAGGGKRYVEMDANIDGTGMLSRREKQVLEQIFQGMKDREIAARLGISLTTVNSHTKNIYRKLEVCNRTQAVTKAISTGILTFSLGCS